MANTHSFINTTRCTCWDVDAYNACGIYASSDLDNGVFVTRGAMQNTNGAINDYAFTVALPSANAVNLWVIDTPEVGSALDVQVYDDPRYFYNPAGKPMSIRYLHPEVDFIEVDANAFASGSAPADQPTYKFASVNTSGRLVIANSAPSSGTYFALAGTKSVDIGNELVTTYILQCVRN